MLTSNLQETLNEKWEHCWPVSDLRPRALLDLISYLFFIKKADDLELIHQTIKSSRIDNFIYSAQTEDFTWSHLQKLNTSEIHLLFTKENGLIDLMNYYGKIDALYSNYFKVPLLIKPTPKLLSNAMEIINIIETNDQLTRENIVEYLFTKARSTGKNPLPFLPEPILKLIISLAEPVQDDTIFDPAACNGNLLLNAFRQIQSNNNYLAKSAISQNGERISGFEPDGVNLRIAAMNMEIHGMAIPNIDLKTVNRIPKEKTSLIISSLVVSDDTEASPEKNNIGFAENEAAVLNDITESLGSNGRAVVLVPKDLLLSENPEIVKSRKKLVDQNELRAVITLDSKNDSLFAGAAVLVFYKSENTSGDIWFYKWRNLKKKNSKAVLNDENINAEFEEVSDILDKWKTRNDQPAITSPNSFFISANYVRSNNYNLSFNDYKLVKQQPGDQKTESPVFEPTEKVIVAKKENLHDFFESSPSLPVEKQKRKLAPILLLIAIITFATLAFYWVYSKNNKNYFSGKIRDSHSNDSVNISPDSNPTSSSDSLVSFKDKSEGETKTNSQTDAKKYTVVNKAWFHYEPDSNKIKPLFLMPRKDLVVTSRKEERGFVYVIYINSKGESTHGWLDKNDLLPVE